MQPLHLRISLNDRLRFPARRRGSAHAILIGPQCHHKQLSLELYTIQLIDPVPHFHWIQCGGALDRMNKNALDRSSATLFMQSSALDRLKMSQNLAKTGQKQGTGCGEANTSIDYFLCMCMITFDQSSAFFGVFRPIQCNLAVVFGSIGEIFSFRGNNCEHTVVW